MWSLKFFKYGSIMFNMVQWHLMFVMCLSVLVVEQPSLVSPSSPGEMRSYVHTFRWPSPSVEPSVFQHIPTISAPKTAQHFGTQVRHGFKHLIHPCQRKFRNLTSDYTESCCWRSLNQQMWSRRCDIAEMWDMRIWRVGSARNAVFFHSFLASQARKVRS